MKFPVSPNMRTPLRSATDQAAVARKETKMKTMTKKRDRKSLSVSSRLLTSLLRRSGPACRSHQRQFLGDVMPLAKRCRRLRACRRSPNGYVLINLKQLNRLHICWVADVEFPVKDPTAQLEKLAQQQSAMLLRKLGNKDGFSGGASQDVSTQSITSQTRIAQSAPVVLSPRPVKGTAAGATRSLERKMDEEEAGKS